jgi:hypothetical protein
LQKYEESLISAHHNYLVNGMLTPGFVLGEPGSKEGFYFLADPVLPGESTPRICARLMDGQGNTLVELKWNRIRANPVGCSLVSAKGGFRLLDATGELLFEVNTENFTNGYLTRIMGTLKDEKGRVRIEQSEGCIKVHEPAVPALDRPYPFA